MAESSTDSLPISFDAHPSTYRHWTLDLQGDVATLAMNVVEDGGLRPGYVLKLNSYDLGVDIELADAIQRLRFEHPEVKVLVITSEKDKIFCSGANIYMLGRSSHAFKVNFCKYTNETRLYLEDLADHTGIKTLCALNGTASGGGYELAMACEHIVLTEDGNSAVSLPEVPLLGVLPGTGGLTRLVDKRKVRRDLADAFSTVAEGVRGKRAVEWGLVDESIPRSRFQAGLQASVERLRGAATERSGPGVALTPLTPRRTEDGHGVAWEHVTLRLDEARRTAELELRGPRAAQPETASALRELGASTWALQAFRELDAAMLELRFNHQHIGLWILKVSGDPATVLAADAALLKLASSDWFAKEILLHMKRVLKRLDLSARTLFAILGEGVAVAGSLAELVFAADRSFMLDAEGGPTLQLGPMNFGPLPMSNGLTRLQTRFLNDPAHVEALRRLTAPLSAGEALRQGLVTFTPDDIDWEDEVRIAIEERAAFSPDALTGMEASLRFAGPETLETKIFGRLSAWQNWIFQRPNAVGERGALTVYGTPERPSFDYRRT